MTRRHAWRYTHPCINDLHHMWCSPKALPHKDDSTQAGKKSSRGSFCVCPWKKIIFCLKFFPFSHRLGMSLITMYSWLPIKLGEKNVETFSLWIFKINCAEEYLLDDTDKSWSKWIPESDEMADLSALYFLLLRGLTLMLKLVTIILDPLETHVHGNTVVWGSSSTHLRYGNKNLDIHCLAYCDE